MLDSAIACSSSCTSSPPLSVMEASALPSPTAETNDVFSISDQALSDRLQFIQEVSRSLPELYAKTDSTDDSIDWFWKLGQRLAMSSQALLVSRWPGEC